MFPRHLPAIVLFVWLVGQFCFCNTVEANELLLVYDRF